MALMLPIINPLLNQELKGQILWDAYFQEMPDEDFTSENAPRWKQSSLDNNKLLFFAQNKISIKDAVKMIFNKKFLDKPAWNKRYLRAYQQWTTAFPDLDHQAILISGALKMGIEFIRFHSRTDVFFSQGRNYLLISYSHSDDNVADSYAILSGQAHQLELSPTATNLSTSINKPLRVQSQRRKCRTDPFICNLCPQDETNNFTTSSRLMDHKRSEHIASVLIRSEDKRILAQLKRDTNTKMFHCRCGGHFKSTNKSSYHRKCYEFNEDIRAHSQIDPSVLTPRSSNDFISNEEVIKSIRGDSSTSPDGEVEEELINPSLRADNQETMHVATLGLS